jgi:hypothetical protein
MAEISLDKDQHRAKGHYHGVAALKRLVCTRHKPGKELAVEVHL